MSWRRGQAYGQDLRDRVLGARGSIREVAARFGVSESFVSRARSRRRKTGQSSSRPQCSHTPSRLLGLETALAAQVEAKTDQTLRDLCQWLEGEHGVRVCVSTMCKALARLGLTLKKSRCTPRSKPVRT